MVAAKGPNLFRGRWRMPERRRPSFARTASSYAGDLGRIDERSYVYILGRDKGLAIPGVPHPDRGRGHRRGGPPKDATVDEQTVLAASDGRLAKFKQPKRVLFIHEPPRKHHGEGVEKFCASFFAGFMRRYVAHETVS